MFEQELSNQIEEILKQNDLEKLILINYQQLIQSSLNINRILILKVQHFLNTYFRYIKIIENTINNSINVDIEDKKRHIEVFKKTLNKSDYWINNFKTLLINLYSESESNNMYFEQRRFDKYE